MFGKRVVNYKKITNNQNNKKKHPLLGRPKTHWVDFVTQNIENTKENKTFVVVYSREIERIRDSCKVIENYFII